MKLTLHEIAKVVGAKNDVTAYKDVALNQIEFDSRKITAGDLFLPLKGARDGHDFIQTAFDNGAIATFTEKELPADQAHILVDDALEAFQELAAYYLEKTGVDVIAVTGSNGKTTTKDMIHDILQRPTALIRHKAITTMRLVFLIQPSTCLMIRRKLSLRWGKTIWEIFISCQTWLSQKQPLLP